MRRELIRGRELSFQIDQSGHQATQFDITVNSPEQPVALILGAYEPTVWNIGWKSGHEDRGGVCLGVLPSRRGGSGCQGACAQQQL